MICIVMPMPETKTLQQLDKEAVLSLLEAADRTRRHFTGILEPWGLTLQQYNVLRILRGAGPGGLPTLEIGERMIEKTPGVSRLVDRLEAHGWVKRERCREDRRRVLCSLTDKASKTLAELDGPIAQADENCLAGLNERDTRRLRDLTSRIQP
jgi:DNA-binding MarR family transcriptional regulator